MEKRQGFFNIPTDWEKHWQGMPEYVQAKRNECFCELTVRVRTKEDLEEFANLMDQQITTKTKTIWYPKLFRERTEHKKYVHAPEES